MLEIRRIFCRSPNKSNEKWIRMRWNCWDCSTNCPTCFSPHVSHAITGLSHVYIVYTCVYPEFPDTSGTSSQNEKNDSVVYQWHSLSHAKYRKRRALPLFTPRITEDLLWTVSDTRDHRKQPGKSPLKLRQYSMTGYCNISNIYVYLYDTIQYKIIQYNTI